MTANTLANAAMPLSDAASLGGFLRERRARLRPGPGAPGRRRTPGLRREEVAARAGVSVTWYTWLEQGRGGPPSDEVLERLARALELDAAGREVMFLLAQQRPPPLNPGATPAVPPALQRVLDALVLSPAFVRTPTWDVVAWNAAAEAVLTLFTGAPEGERNALRRLFRDPAAVQFPHLEWEHIARFAVGVFRVDVARAGMGPEAAALIAELEVASPEFRRFWAESDARHHGFGRKLLNHPEGGVLEMDFAAFSVDGAPGLNMIVYTPASPAAAEAVARLMAKRCA